MEEELIAFLLADPGISGLVNDRVNFMDRPDDALPALVIQVADANTEYTHSGKSDLSYSRVQADCWGRTYGSAKLLARAYTSRIEAGGAVGGVTFYEGLEINNSDMPTGMEEGGPKLFRVMTEFYVPWKLTP